MTLVRSIRPVFVIHEDLVTIAPASSAVVSSTDKAEYRSADFTLTIEDTVTGAVKSKRLSSKWTDSDSVEQIYGSCGTMPELTTAQVTISNYEVSVTNNGLNPIMISVTKQF